MRAEQAGNASCISGEVMVSSYLSSSLAVRASVAFLLVGLESGCALTHERPGADAGQRVVFVETCHHGAITECVGCEQPGCCQHVCLPDDTWSACSFVPNACPRDGGAALTAFGGDR